ncbi:MAG: integrase arm-type DNA-binding domain-containing protein [Chloroflexota bacterium]|nr:integrase arm-type DNA-binding domain-containing protein [Chloroflexota bacterium]
MKLSATRVKALKDPGRYSDGDGLHLFINRKGRKSWVQRITIDGRRRDIGLGGYPKVSLAQARKRASDNREAVGNGMDPVAEKRRPSTPTFSEAARTVHEANKPRWRNGSHTRAWIQTLQRHAFPKIGSKPIDAISRTEVLAVLTPIWSSKPETARRVRQRMRTIFRWAMANELIEANPAGEAIDGALPSMPKVKAHLRALPYQEVGSAMKTVYASQTSPASKLCLKFLVLTAARSGEARGTTWAEIDIEDATWTIPGSRMKAGIDHRVPLSNQALDVLTYARQLEDGSGLCFPSPLRPGRMLSDMTLTNILRKAGLADRATVHGFRTSFKTWTMEQTDTPWAVGEAALAHQLGGSVEQAYARSDLFDRRRTLMQQWADYLAA